MNAHLSGRPEHAFAILGVVLLAAWGSGEWSSHQFQVRAEGRLRDALGTEATAGAGHPTSTGMEPAPPARIEIPRLALHVMVAEGTSARVLEMAVGHVRSSARPGEAGNCVLTGHRDTFFRPLQNIRVGDVIRMTTPDGAWRYRVTSFEVVSPRRTDLLRATQRPTLTLVTCYPFRLIGPAPMRFVVQAERVGT